MQTAEGAYYLDSAEICFKKLNEYSMQGYLF